MSEKLFNLDKEYSIVCRSENTRYGFRHLATLLKNGCDIGSAKCTYQNRTWESYTFESVIVKLLKQYFDDKQLSHYKKVCAKTANNDIKNNFGVVSAVAKMGDVICTDKKSNNDWKKRMLEAGINGLKIPDDWEELSEEEKEKRLNKVISIASKN